MDSKNKHIIYTAKDIHKYLLGKMNAAEMHAIEKAALDDPLLAEAIEGFNDAPGFTQQEGFENIKNDLTELKNRINIGSIKTGTVKKISSLWRAAAAILLLVGGTVLAIYINSSLKTDPSATIAKNELASEPEIPTVTDSSKNLVQVDDSKKTTKPGVVKTEKPALTIPDVSTTTESKRSDLTVTSDTVASGMRSVAPPPAVAEETADYVKTDDKEVSEKAKRAEGNFKKSARSRQLNPTFSGIVTDKNNNPIPYTTIVTSNGFRSTTDQNGQFSLTLPRNNSRKIIFRANNFQPKIIDPKNGYQPIILESSRIQNNRNLATKPGQAAVLYSKNAEPKRGWPKYISFLIEKISYSEYDTGIPVVGETIVSFDLNTNAEPVNFTFEKQIDEDVNEAIEEIITTGPEWKITNKTALPATIKLKLIF